MSELDDAFEKAQIEINKLSKRPDDATSLKLYAFYKQASMGDVQGDKPGFFDFIGAAKYEAWAKNKGMSQVDAQKNYINLATKIID